MARVVEKAQMTPVNGLAESSNGKGERHDPHVLIRAPVLVLNLNYVPVNVCSVRRAIVMVDKGKAELLEQHEGSLHTVAGAIEAPAIIRLVYLVKRPFLPPKALQERGVPA